MPTSDITQKSINTIRTLAMDAVQAANSGHPGTPMAMAPVAYNIWQNFLRFDPNDPIWPNRDRFVLSIGHASTLLYALLHLTGVKAVNPKYEIVGKLSVTLEDIKCFRQLDSRTPGHPEYRWTSGVETTTGPLGQGVATSVGMAIAARWLAAHFNRPGYELFDYYVSLEVNPALAHDSDVTIAEARRLFAALDRPKIMIKVPATPAGIPAIETLIGEGINVNVTLIFSLSHYEAVAAAYLSGLEKLAANEGDLSKVASVASFFISRVDTVVDDQLGETGNTALQGKIGIANAKVAYGRFQQIFSGPRWEDLVEKGARMQRPLWASTGVKKPTYPDTLYVDQLIGPNTVNTVPPSTLTAFFRDHGSVAAPLGQNLAEAQAQLDQLASLGLDLEAITQQLQDDGVTAFADSFTALIESVADKRQKLQSRAPSLAIA